MGSTILRQLKLKATCTSRTSSTGNIPSAANARIGSLVGSPSPYICAQSEFYYDGDWIEPKSMRLFFLGWGLWRSPPRYTVCEAVAQVVATCAVSAGVVNHTAYRRIEGNAYVVAGGVSLFSQVLHI